MSRGTDQYGDEELDVVLKEAQELYTLGMQSMEAEIVQSVESRVSFIAFVCGALLASGAAHGLEPRVQAASFYVAFHEIGFKQSDAKELAYFGMDAAGEDSPWNAAFEAGGEARDALVAGSEVRALELLSETLSRAGELRTALCAGDHLLRRVVRILGD